MLTRDIRKTFRALPESSWSSLLALSVLIERIDSLPKADRDDLFELLQGWSVADDPDERQGIQRAMEEILAQVPPTASPMAIDEGRPMARGLKARAEHVGRKIRELRDGAGMTQVQLAERSGLPQSHISRLENAEHSATDLTLEKIAKALGVHVGDIAPGPD